MKMTEEWNTSLKVSKFIGGDILSDLIMRRQNARAMLVIFISLRVRFVGHFDAKTKVWEANDSLKKKEKTEEKGTELICQETKRNH